MLKTESTLEQHFEICNSVHGITRKRFVKQKKKVQIHRSRDKGRHRDILLGKCGRSGSKIG
jgi:hypothetical protein